MRYTALPVGLALLLSAPAFADWWLGGQKGPRWTRVATGNDALHLALADVKGLLASGKVTPHDTAYLRYVWVRSGEPEDAKVVSLTANMLSRSPGMYRPVPVSDGKALLMRLDLRDYAPQPADLRQLTRDYEELQFDPRFNLLLTHDVLNQLAVKDPKRAGRGWVCRWEKVSVPPYVHKGKTFTSKWHVGRAIEDFTFGTLKDLKNVVLIRLPSAYLDLQTRLELEALTYSQAPLITDAYFVRRAMSQIQGKKAVFTTIYGGLYYKLAGIRKAAKKGVTDEDQLFTDVGAGDLGGNVKAVDVLEKLRNDQRFAIFRSKVTGSPRRGDLFRTRLVRLETAQSIISVTHDIANDDIDIGTHPLFNLRDAKDVAREILWERANGLQAGALIKADDGSLQDVVPQNIAKDHTQPAPFHGELEPMISCIACHWADGSDGWIKTKNDAKRRLGPGKRLDVFADLNKRNDDLRDTLDRLAGQYQGEPERALVRARDDLARAVLQATGPWKELKGQSQVAKVAAQRMMKTWRDYWYEEVGAYTACLELGVKVRDKRDAPKVLGMLIKPDLRAAVVVPELGQFIVPEDIRLGQLLDGDEVNRWDWDLFHAFAAERSRGNLLRMLAEPKGN